MLSERVCEGGGGGSGDIGKWHSGNFYLPSSLPSQSSGTLMLVCSRHCRMYEDHTVTNAALSGVTVRMPVYEYSVSSRMKHGTPRGHSTSAASRHVTLVCFRFAYVKYASTSLMSSMLPLRLCQVCFRFAYVKYASASLMSSMLPLRLCQVCFRFAYVKYASASLMSGHNSRFRFQVPNASDLPG